MHTHSARIRDDHFEKLEQVGSYLGEDMMIKVMLHFNKLSAKVEDLNKAIKNSKAGDIYKPKKRKSDK